MDKKGFQSLLNNRKGQPAPQTGGPSSTGKSPHDGQVDQVVTLVGTARDAAMGAVLALDGGGAIYLDGLDEWPKNLSSKRVEVKGTLRRKKLAPDPDVAADGAVSHGMAGSSLVVEGASWTVLP